MPATELCRPGSSPTPPSQADEPPRPQRGTGRFEECYFYPPQQYLSHETKAGRAQERSERHKTQPYQAFQPADVRHTQGPSRRKDSASPQASAQVNPAGEEPLLFGARGGVDARAPAVEGASLSLRKPLSKSQPLLFAGYNDAHHLRATADLRAALSSPLLRQPQLRP